MTRAGEYVFPVAVNRPAVLTVELDKSAAPGQIDQRELALIVSSVEFA